MGYEAPLERATIPDRIIGTFLINYVNFVTTSEVKAIKMTRESP